jgi:hypothetical protein
MSKRFEGKQGGQYQGAQGQNQGGQQQGQINYKKTKKKLPSPIRECEMPDHPKKF